MRSHRDLLQPFLSSVSAFDEVNGIAIFQPCNAALESLPLFRARWDIREEQEGASSAQANIVCSIGEYGHRGVGASCAK